MNQLILTIILILALNQERPEEKIQKKELVESSNDTIKVSQITQAVLSNLNKCQTESF